MSEAVSPAMRQRISAALDRIAEEEECLILFAIESGSRAWGFHSRDSDYDVRFVYARPVSWHLQIGDKRDVIERPISDELDLSGWELRKALALAARSNAVIAEWLQSPILYREVDGARQDLTGFCRKVLTRKPVTWHYLRLLKRQKERLVQPDGRIRMKRYFYALRPALCLRWMRLHDHAVLPMDMPSLMAASDLPVGVSGFINDLIARKREAGEIGTAAGTDASCDALIAEEAALAEAWLASNRAPPAPSQNWANDLHARYTRMAGG